MTLNDHKSQPARLNKSRLRELAQMDLPRLFSSVYKNAYWGAENGHAFYSGSGSHDKKLVRPYIEQVRRFLLSLQTSPSIVDLGCGDFAIGRQLTDLCSSYHGCDVVNALIEYNRENFEQAAVRFSCIDASREKLPSGNVLIVRQVLQHLCNDAIAAILKQFPDFQYIIVTEHLPDGKFTSNIDKPSGPDSRLRLASGVDITAPPFSLRPAFQEVLHEVKDNGDFPGVIKTTLYYMGSPR
mgnify:CR=1 FL=1